MKIAMLSKADSSGGGASKVAEDLTYLLRNNGHFVDHFTRSKSNYSKTIPLYSQFEKKIYHRLLDIGIQEYYPFERKVIKHHDKLNDYDIFHFHDITSTISPLTIKYLSDRGKKIVWTIHDCSIVTGGCINPLDCTNYLNTCKNCPQLGQFGLGRNIDFTSIFHNIKKYVLNNSNITFVSPSKWIADLIYNTGYIKNYPIIISNGVDLDIFKSYNKNKIREELNLPINRFIILLSSSEFNNPYKGIKYAIEVIKLLKEINPYILMVGEADEKMNHLLKDFDKFATGYIEDKIELNKYYSSADIFLNTTVADNQPLTVLEVMASGTPNIGFATGGIPEIITQGIHGYLINNNDINLLSAIIIKLYNQNSFEKMGIKARETVGKNHNIQLFLEAYSNLYQEIS